MIAVITQRQQVKMAFDKIKVTNPIVEMDGLFSPISSSSSSLHSLRGMML